MRLVPFEVVIEVMTPLHIGTGEELHPDADFVVEPRQGGGRVARIIDVDGALLAMTPEEIASIRDGRVAAALGERLRRQYTRALVPVRGQGNVTRTRALQKLPDGRPYIPGTTVKGSIRTALLHALVDKNELDGLPKDGHDPKSAAKSLEESAFGVNLPGVSNIQFPNRDLNRAVRVTDFVPEGSVSVAFVNMSAHRLGGRTGREGASIPIWCEAVEPGARFRGTITVEVESPLWNVLSIPQRETVNNLFRTWREAGRRLLDAERDVWGGQHRSVAEFFRALGDAEHYAVLGWGGGWRSKTLGTLIPAQRLPDIARQFKLQRWQGRDFPERFPVTRKLAQGPNGLLPPGWVKIRASRQGSDG